MRLLERQSDGGFRLTEDLLDKDIGRYQYAILSHTWGQPNEEVTFEDMESSGRGKAGYKKIKFCGEQAARDGLQYFWVDSCCIKKSSDPELSEAINSMYRWYSRAARCYVYLSDVSIGEDSGHPSQSTWEWTFRASRWFSRGWTLQELLAPDSVEFFSQEGKKLGDKRSLARQIHEITGISLPALQGTSLSQFSVGERLKWAQNRVTTREEDWAYSLLGIFGISMPLIYGEGKERAAIRLRKEIKESSNDKSQDTNLVLKDLVKCLPAANDAPFNSLAKQHEPSCLPETRVDLLQDIYDWVDGQRCIYWLSGLAGTGKSTIARTVARKCFDHRRLGASFFFARGGGDVGNASKFVTSIAIQLASNVRALRPSIYDAVSEHSDITSLSLRDQWQMLVVNPLSKLEGNGQYASYVLIVDALDECDDDESIGMIFQLLSDARALKASHLRVFLTSRSGNPIRHGFSKIPDNEHKDFILHNISRSIVDDDISAFLRHSLGVIAQERSLKDGWPGEEAIRCMVHTASGLFIWAATACRFIREGQRFAAKRLEAILKGSGSITVPEKHLDEIYITVLQHSISPKYTDEEKEESYHILRQMLGSIVILLSPLSICSLSRLLCLPKEDINQTLEDLHSVLDIPKSETLPLRLHHPSFRDFLINEDRCKDQNLRVDEKQAHRTLTDKCIQLMSTYLRQDICEVKTPGVFVAEIERDKVDQSLPPELQYACLYWVQHFQRSLAHLHDDDEVHRFLQEHFLHWLEALGWMGRVSEGIYAVTTLEPITAAHNCPQLSTFIHDAKRFVLYNRQAVEQAPLQVYCSALMFSPAKSVVRNMFKECPSRWVQTLPVTENNWNALLQTLEGHLDCVWSVAFSPDSSRLASTSDDCTVRVWDARSGECLQTLKGHGSCVNAVAFSPDSARLASASDDDTVKMWDARNGECVAMLEGHKYWVTTVAFSPDSAWLASASGDRTVKVWDARSGECVATLEGHKNCVNTVAFSPDSAWLASTSDDDTVKIWDARSGECVATLKSHKNCVGAVAFSPNSARLASASRDRTVKVWDTHSGKCVATLKGHGDSVTAVAFSPDSARLASSSRDHTVKIWDARSGECLQTLSGGKTLFDVSFDATGSYLLTDIGAIALDAPSDSRAILDRIEPQDARYRGAAVSSDGMWITYDTQKWVWIPSEYRPSSSAVVGKTIGIGTRSGKVWMCTVKSAGPEPD